MGYHNDQRQAGVAGSQPAFYFDSIFSHRAAAGRAILIAYFDLDNRCS